MTDDQIALARRAVACKAWKWTPGMRAVRADAIAALLALRLVARDEGPGVSGSPPAEWLPDLSDPATKGCLLGLVREAWDEPEIHIRPSLRADRIIWTPWCGAPLTDRLGNLEIEGGSEKEVLVATLEAAP